MHLFRLAVILAAFATPLVAVAGQQTTPSGACALKEAIITVVPLTCGRAGEPAYTLSRVAPPQVRIVPYHSTNSLIISGPSAEVATDRLHHHWQGT
jgi:hypothetical protein